MNDQISPRAFPTDGATPDKPLGFSDANAAAKALLYAERIAADGATTAGERYLHVDWPEGSLPAETTVYIPPCLTCAAKDAEIAELRAALAEAQRDGERLDFLEAEATHDHARALFRANRPITRDAIDLARSPSQPKPQ